MSLCAKCWLSRQLLGSILVGCQVVGDALVENRLWLGKTVLTQTIFQRRSFRIPQCSRGAPCGHAQWNIWGNSCSLATWRRAIFRMAPKSESEPERKYHHHSWAEMLAFRVFSQFFHSVREALAEQKRHVHGCFINFRLATWNVRKTQIETWAIIVKSAKH